MRSEVFESRKGRHIWPQRTICEVHRELYDRLRLGVDKRDWALIEHMLPQLEEAYLLGIKMTKAMVEKKLSLPEWQDNSSAEAKRLRHLRITLEEDEKAGRYLRS